VRWRISPVEALAWRKFEHEVIVRNGLTGSTHLVDSLAAEVLLTLMSANRALSAGELAAALAGGEGETEPELLPSIEATLSQFQRLGIAEPSD
jgi:PqqD family protein of HPr-rel-A system